jgi:hypothetical protein
MPFTAAHPAAVLPLRRFSPRLVLWSGLIIGAISPDLDYFLFLNTKETHGHSFAGSLYFCVPLGLVILILFHRVVKRPMTLLLPPSESRRLWPLACRSYGITAHTVAAACLSLLVGAWSHLIWDAFTHQDSWGPRHIPALNYTFLALQDYPLTLFRVLQDALALFGIGALAWSYYRWRSRQEPVDATAIPLLSRGQRLGFLALWVLLTVLAAGIYASGVAPNLIGFGNIRLAVGYFVIGAISFGGLWVLVISVILLRRSRETP